MTTQPATATRFAATYPGRPDQVQRRAPSGGKVPRRVPSRRRRGPDRVRTSSNAVLHSASRGEFFTVRAELHPDYVWVEAEDLGGPWRYTAAPTTARTASTWWKRLPARTAGEPTATSDGGRVVWARLDLAAGE